MSDNNTVQPQSLTLQEWQASLARMKKRDETYRFLVYNGSVHVRIGGKTVATAVLADLVRVSEQTLEQNWDDERQASVRFRDLPDRGLSLMDWEKWIVDGIIDAHAEGADAIRITDAFDEEVKRRFGDQLK